LAHQLRQNPHREFFLPPAKGPHKAPKRDKVREMIISMRKQNLSVYDISRVLKSKNQELSPVSVSKVLKDCFCSCLLSLQSLLITSCIRLGCQALK
jgi:hypothetical protein